MQCKYVAQNINDTRHSNALATGTFCSERSDYTHIYLYMGNLLIALDPEGPQSGRIYYFDKNERRHHISLKNI